MVAPLTGAWIETRNEAGAVMNNPEVAPLTGAWIETNSIRHYLPPSKVAPLTGAWIETLIQPVYYTDHLVSHPSRVRGLKRSTGNMTINLRVSHPSRVRGLKHVSFAFSQFVNRSHPSRVRGLKQKINDKGETVDNKD